MVWIDYQLGSVMMMNFMTRVLGRVKNAAKDEEGASGLEYAVLAGMVVVVLATTAGPIKTAVNGIFGSVRTAVEAVAPAAGG
jgi:pilus assembly protein Flp/PilA